MFMIPPSKEQRTTIMFMAGLQESHYCPKEHCCPSKVKGPVIKSEGYLKNALCTNETKMDVFKNGKQLCYVSL